ncbi:DeoR/GlpR family DNA-binding transcription regulator [Halobacillus salinarum]|uniref:DeoR/GlpR family DNA-binding transcription regulator n=1 Tax=Halobacillus salinarum TaxID=2932257 RepID=A0ABY4EM67_9BACI|nr:DeoR/GlpR family DNA-binding transcription regulator [Halobacillus salinarum]UOQ45548.1 DeoR/GlpR family DNA-binding transcription regulator [Halobacillus salinarum]
MIKVERINELLDYVHQKQTASLDELVKEFNVSKNTIRRDVQELVEQGKLKKVYGGVSVNQSSTLPFHHRQIQNHQEKIKIAELAASYVEDGDIIFLDSGTTTVEMLDFIKQKNLVIVTNNLDFTLEATPYENLKIYSTGGMYERSTKSYTGLESAEAIKSYNFSKVFMASTGVSLTNGVTNSSPLETQIKSAVVNRSEEVFLLVDHSKFDKYSLTTYCRLEDINYMVTGEEPEDKYKQFAEKNNMKLVYPE